ncbi:MAG: hypothetical protein WA830_11705 [Candidatus Sulfotelmatobacter sp.]
MLSACSFQKARATPGARPWASLERAEQYASVKLRLFRALDEIEDLKTHGRRLSIDTGLLEQALASLGVD